jgi:hypothetical protein
MECVLRLGTFVRNRLKLILRFVGYALSTPFWQHSYAAFYPLF